MELLLAILAFIASMLAVDVAAIGFGVDSRDTIRDSWWR
jgi:hypothetical protein